MKTKNKVEIGKKYESKCNGEFVVIKREEVDKKGAWYLIEFVETKTRLISSGSNILKGKIKDKYFRSVYGVGYIGNVDKPTKHPLYNIWSNMIKRCYYKEDKNYNTYGGKGVTVSKEWHCFENYINDISKKENYELLINNKKEWNIDKDIICNEKNINPKIYSNETTKIINQSLNIIIREVDKVQDYETTGKGVHSKIRYGGLQWCATFYDRDNGKTLKKYFSENVYGYDAKKMAVEQRLIWEKEYKNKKAYEILKKTEENFRNDPQGFLGR